MRDRVLRTSALLALLCFAAVLLTGRARAEPEPEPAALDLTNARILASPGWPGALRPFLPPGREVEPLALPLPPGPVLVLGLVAKDPVARAVGETILGWKPGEDLHGGYVVEARKDGDRALAVILADDAAALAAARFELETFTPTGKEAEPRSVEFKNPNEEGGVRVAPGRRTLRPKYRVRGATGLGPGETLLDIAAAHANRMWVTPDVSDRDLALLRDHGIEPVGWTRNAKPRASPAPVGDVDLTKVLPALLDLQRRGVRRFALDGGRQAASERERCPEDRLAHLIGDALRPGGLQELLVVPFDSRFATSANKVLRDLPEAALGWKGPTDEPLEITRLEAEKRRRDAGVPVLLVETWMEAAGGDEPRIPSLPRGRSGDLGEVLDGVVFLPGPGSAAALAAAWSPPESDAFAELGELLGACVQNARDGTTFLLESAACLEQTLDGRYADPPWLQGLPQRWRERAAALPPSEALVLARMRDEAITVDGRLGEAAWGEADWHRVGVVDVAAVSDGRRLVLALRFPTSAPPASVVALGTSLLRMRASDPTGVPVSQGSWGYTEESGVVRVEAAFDHYALRGDPYPTRYLPIDLAVRQSDGIHLLGHPKPFDPEGPLPGRRGGLLILR